MSAPPILGRRWFIAAMAFGAASSWRCRAEADRGSGRDGEQVRRKLVSLLHEPERAQRIGMIYLESRPETLAAALALIEVVLAEIGPDARREALRGYILARIRRELEKVEVVSVDGWIMSSTEAQLCGLAALGNSTETQQSSV
jgi:hypothetical protein